MTLFLLSSLPLAGKAPAALSEPLWIDLDPLQPRMCISMVPGAGAFRGKDAEAWSKARRELESGDLKGAIATTRDLKPHPAQRSIRAAAYLLGDGQALDLEPLVAKYPEDACLAVMAAAVAMRGNDTAGMVRNIEAAHAVWPDQPDVAELYALAGSTPGERAERFRKAVVDYPDDLSLRYAVAQLAEQDGDIPTAVAGYRRVWELGRSEVGEKLERMALRAGDLDTYLRVAYTDDVPVKGPGFSADTADYAKAYLAWLGLESATDPLYAVFETEQGEMRCRLEVANAPITVMNFVGLARGEQPWTRSGLAASGPLYDSTIFHRVIPDFMIQGGDPEGTGRGSPGYRFRDEPSPDIAFDAPGVLAMANSGPDTNGSQFFITEGPTPHLSGKHTVFGHCDARALDTVRRITGVPRDSSDRPSEDVVLQRVRIEK
ncbi:MAG: peptidylprolyl isomerase [Myxococcota bacterium]